MKVVKKNIIKITQANGPSVNRDGSVSKLDVAQLFHTITNDVAGDDIIWDVTPQIVWESDDRLSYGWYPDISVSSFRGKHHILLEPLYGTHSIRIKDAKTQGVYACNFKDLERIPNMVGQDPEALKVLHNEDFTRYQIPFAPTGRVVFAKVEPIVKDGRVSLAKQTHWIFSIPKPIESENDMLYTTEFINYSADGMMYQGAENVVHINTYKAGRARPNTAYVTRRIDSEIASNTDSILVTSLRDSMLVGPGKGCLALSEEVDPNLGVVNAPITDEFIQARFTEEYPHYEKLTELLDKYDNAIPVMDYLSAISYRPDENTARFRSGGEVVPGFKPIMTIKEFIKKNKLDKPLPKFDSVEAFLTNHA